MCVANSGAILHLIHFDDPSTPDENNFHHFSFEKLLSLHLDLLKDRAVASNSPIPLTLHLEPPTTPITHSPDLTHHLENPSRSTPLDTFHYPFELGIPPSLISTTLPIPHEGSITNFQPTSRALQRDQTIIWTLTAEGHTLTLDNPTFINILMHHSLSTSQKKPPKPPSLPALHPIYGDFNPLLLPQSQWTQDHPYCGLPVRIRSLPHSVNPPPPNRASPRCSSTDHDCTVEAVLTSPSHPTQLWLRSLHDHTISFTTTDLDTLNSGSYRYHTATPLNRHFGKLRSRLSTGDPLPPVEGTSDSLTSKILAFAHTLPNTPSDLFGCGILCTDKPIPRHLQPAYREAFHQVASLLTSHQVEAIKVLLVLDGMLLAPYPHGQSFSSILNLRLSLFMAGDFQTLSQSITQRRATEQSDDHYHDSDDPHGVVAAKCAERILVRTGSVRRAAKKLREEPTPPCATPSSSTLLQQFTHLCPSAGTAAPADPFSNSQSTETETYPLLLDPIEAMDDSTHLCAPTFSSHDVTAAVGTRDTASAAGLSGLGFSSLRILLQLDDALTHSLSDFLNLVASGSTHPVTRQFLIAGRAILIPKENGGVRPIVVGECLTRLITAMVLKTAETAIQHHLLPYQLGCGVPNGTDTTCMTVQSILDLHPDWIAIKLDVRNAFNTFERNRTWPLVQSITPTLYPLYAYLYGVSSDQIFRDTDLSVHSVPSMVGSRQGCVLGTFAYNMSLHPILQHINENVLTTPHATLLAYVDDAVIVAPPDEAIMAFKEYSHRLTSQTLSALRLDKCEIYSPTTPPTLLHAPPTCKITTIGVKLLGTAITSSPNFLLSHLNTAMQPFFLAVSRLPNCRSFQTQFTLLQKSILHLTTYHLRAHSFSSHPQLQHLCIAIDQAVRDTIQRLCCPAGPLSLAGWLVASLPQSLGGLGLQSATNSCDVAHLARYITTSTFVRTHFPFLSEVLPSHTSFLAPQTPDPSTLSQLARTAATALSTSSTPQRMYAPSC